MEAPAYARVRSRTSEWGARAELTSRTDDQDENGQGRYRSILGFIDTELALQVIAGGDAG